MSDEEKLELINKAIKLDPNEFDAINRRKKILDKLSKPILSYYRSKTIY